MTPSPKKLNSLDHESKIFMLPCAGVSNVGQLTLRAVQELVLEGKGEWGRFDQDTDLLQLSSKTIKSRSFIVVDGCTQQCGRKRLKALNCDFEFHLSLSDLGIEKTDDTEIVYDELQLVKDAIIAESTRLSKQPPMIIGGCGCR